MRKITLLLPLITVLTGCPNSRYEGAQIGKSKAVFIENDVVCFSVDKKDVLTRYNLWSNEDDEKRLIVAEGVKLSYPNTCIKVELKKGYQYSANFSLNGKPYHYSFFIDNNGNIVDTGTFPE